MTLPALCIQRPVMTTSLTLAIVLVGMIGYVFLPVAALPKVDFPTISVSTSLPGASPSTMAASIASPLEREFAAIAGVDSITSVSGLGVGRITVQFNLNRNIDAAAQDIQAAIASASRKLPAEMTTPPSYRKVNPSDTPVLLLTLKSATVPLSVINEYVEINIGQRHIDPARGRAGLHLRLAEIRDPGPGRSRLAGDPRHRARRGSEGARRRQLEHAGRIAQRTAKGGDVAGGHRADEGVPPTSPLIIAYRNGAPVRLGEVAHIVDGVLSDKGANWFNGVRAMSVPVLRQADANTVEVANRIKALLPAIRAELPGAIDIAVRNDLSVPIQAAVTDMQHTLVLTVILVVLVIFLFVRRLSATIIPALALPVSIIGTFAAMYLAGYSLDNVSLMALTLAVGFVVDDAVVMLENIVRHSEAGLGPMEAALKGSREITFTIISMTISLVAVFIPVFFMGGVIGRVFNEFAVVIGLAILVSGIRLVDPDADAVQPFPARARSCRRNRGRIGAFWSADTWPCSEPTNGRWNWSCVIRDSTLGVTALTIALTGYLFYVIPKGLFPIEDTGYITVGTETAEDTSFAGMVEKQLKIDAIIRASPYVASYNNEVGLVGARMGVNGGAFYIQLKPRDQRPPVGEVIQELRRQVGAVTGINVFFQPVQNLNIGVKSSRSLYQYTLQSGNLDELYRFAPLVEAQMRRLPALQDVGSDLQIKNPQAIVNIDRQKAAALGLTAEQIRTTLYNSFGSRQVATIYTAEQRLRGHPGARPVVPGEHRRPVESVRAVEPRANSSRSERLPR